MAPRSTVQAVSTTGAQSYTGATTLNGKLNSNTAGAITVTGAATLAHRGDRGADGGRRVTDDITFTSTLNGARDLTLVAGGGDIALQGTVGGTTPLSSFTITSANTASLPVMTINGPLIDHATTTTLNGNLTETFTSVSGAIVLATGPITVQAVNDDMFLATINGAHALTLLSAGGSIVITGAIGGTTPLSSLTVSADVAGLQAVTTSGAQSYSGVTTTTLNGTLLVNTGGAGVSAGNVSLAAGGGAITLTGSNAANDVTLGTVNGAQALAITAGGGDLVLGAVGGGTALTTVTLTGNTASSAGGDDQWGAEL